jgi:hypothetical protein
MNNQLILLGLGLAGVTFAILATKLGKSLAGKDRTLKPYFKRLGQVAPAHPCPCKKPAGPYERCCRPGDVEKIEQDVRDYIFSHWMRRSGGRSKARPMQARLEDFPMSKVTLPDWVTSPSDYSFPIEETILREWTPIERSADMQDAMDSSDNVPI